MKKNTLGLLILVLLSSVLLPTLAATQEGKTLLVGVGLRPVFQDKVSDGQYSGLDVELGMAIAAEAGYKVELVDYPWPRIAHLMKTGDIDLTFSAGMAEDRLAWARFTQEYFRHGRNYFYVLKSRKEEFRAIHNLSQLESYDFTMGVQRGYNYSSEFERLIEKDWFVNRLQVLNEPETVVEALVKGRVDAMAGSEYGTAHILKQKNADQAVQRLFNLTPDDEDSKTYMMFSRSSVSQEVVDNFDAAIKRLRASGKLQAITRQYESSE